MNDSEEIFSGKGRESVKLLVLIKFLTISKAFWSIIKNFEVENAQKLIFLKILILRASRVEKTPWEISQKSTWKSLGNYLKMSRIKLGNKPEWVFSETFPSFLPVFFFELFPTFWELLVSYFRFFAKFYFINISNNLQRF